MRSLITVLLAGTVLGGCAATPPSPPLPPPAAVTEPAPPAPEPPPAPKAQFGTFGFDNAGMDTSVAPGDDFYLYANGNWAKNTPIPPDKSNFGAFTVLQDLSQQRVRDILEAAKDDPSSRIGMAYSSSSRRRSTGRDLMLSVAVPSPLMRTQIEALPLELK